MKPYYQEKTDSVEFKINKRKAVYVKAAEYRAVASQANVSPEYFHNQYKAKIIKNAVRLK